MPQMVSELSKERQLILLCSRGVLNKEHTERINEILSGRLDWREILYQGVTHRTLNLMYYHLKNLGLTGKVEEEVLKIMKTQCKVYGLRNRTYFAEIKKIYGKLNENGIRAAILKGNFLSANVYPSVETRTFNDIDFLIDLKDGDKIVKILEDMGYVQGQYDEETGEILPSTRKEKMYHQLSTGELKECLKKNDDPFVPLYQGDLNYTILWKGNFPYNVETSELLERAMKIEFEDSNIYVLDYEDFLIQLACHLYKEAALLFWINDLRDLKIYKFADIAIFIEKFNTKIRWNKLIEFCQRTGCGKIVYYAFHYVNLMYGQVIPQEVMTRLEPEDKRYLDEYGVENKTPGVWKHDFFTRLFDTDRVLELTGEASEAKKKFIDAEKRILES